MLGIISLATGLIIGFITSLMFKHWRFLAHNAICENFVMFAMSLISDFGTTIIVIGGIEMSGIIALLTFGIV